ncbi:CorA family divalent cation transporter [Amaricoccus sp.]|uniref:CorA family divalent cation transporter n=1 Tax=Amaricoccus sp. TaxID=1872485 RepID=UPI0039E5DACE
MTALMLPGTLVVGFFGMNTSGMPFETPAWGTVAALGIGIALTVAFYRIMVRAGATLRF